MLAAGRYSVAKQTETINTVLPHRQKRLKTKTEVIFHATKRDSSMLRKAGEGRMKNHLWNEGVCLDIEGVFEEEKKILKLLQG